MEKKEKKMNSRGGVLLLQMLSGGASIGSCPL